MMDSLPREYRIAPENRRCCWYLSACCIVMAVTICCHGLFIQNRDLSRALFAGIVCLTLAGVVLLPLRWKLRIDERGIARRLVIRWAHWTWDDLSSGRIQKRERFTLYDPAKLWGRRQLSLTYLSENDTKEIVAEINKHYRLPPPPEVSDSLTIKYGFRRQVTFDPKGVHLLVSGDPRVYMWTDIRNVHITRMDPVRRDFTSLVIALPDREIELMPGTYQGKSLPIWRGATSEEVNEFLLRWVPSDKIDTAIVGELPENREHVKHKLRKAEKAAREVAIVMALALPVFLALLVAMAIADGLLKAILMTGMLAPVFGPVFWSVYRHHRKQIAELRDRLDSNEDPPN